MATIVPVQLPRNHTTPAKNSPPPDQLLAHISTNVALIVECPREARCHAHRRLPSLSNFIHQVYNKCRLTPALLVVALIYLDRLKCKLPTGSQGGMSLECPAWLYLKVLHAKYFNDRI